MKIKDVKGMTLIEIMVVIAIMGLIMGIVGVSVMKQFGKAKIQTARTQIKSFEQGLDQFYLDNGSYPSTDQGLKALVEGEYMKKIDKDPWKRDYNYSSPGASGNPYEITSSGPDKQEGTEDDIKSWELE